VAGGNGADAPVGVRPAKQPRVGNSALHPPNDGPNGRLAALVAGIEKRRSARAEGADDHAAVPAAAGNVQLKILTHNRGI